MNNKLLSIGSVVLLKDANKRIMIIGYYPTVVDDGKEITYDYSGCLFPEGVMDSRKSMLFNHNDVDKIFYYGLMDEEQNDFMIRLNEAVNEEVNNNSVNLEDGVSNQVLADNITTIQSNNINLTQTNDINNNESA